jgi:hypothetical protein
MKENTLFFELSIKPENYQIPAWIYVEKEAGYVREYFEECLTFLLYGSPATEAEFIDVMSQPKKFNRERFFSLLPEILESVLDDSPLQKNFNGFFSEYLVNLISVNAASLGIAGIKNIKQICADWEDTLGDNKGSRLGDRGDW